MVLNKVSSKDDYSFPAAKQDYLLLHEKFRLPPEMEIEMIMLAFEKGALKVADEIIRTNGPSSVLGIWEKLEKSLYIYVITRVRNERRMQRSYRCHGMRGWTL